MSTGQMAGRMELTMRHGSCLRVHAALRSGDTDIASLAEANPSSSEWAHTWRAALSQLPWIGLDEWWPGVCCTANRGTPESHPQKKQNKKTLCPHAVCQGQPASLSHGTLSCPVSHGSQPYEQQ